MENIESGNFNAYTNEILKEVSANILLEESRRLYETLTLKKPELEYTPDASILIDIETEDYYGMLQTRRVSKDFGVKEAYSFELWRTNDDGYKTVDANIVVVCEKEKGSGSEKVNEHGKVLSMKPEIFDRVTWLSIIHGVPENLDNKFWTVLSEPE